MNEVLSDMIERARQHRMSEREYSEQRIAFAFGNAPHGSNTTKEQVRTLVNSATVPVGLASLKTV